MSDLTPETVEEVQAAGLSQYEEDGSVVVDWDGAVRVDEEGDSWVRAWVRVGRKLEARETELRAAGYSDPTLAEILDRENEHGVNCCPKCSAPLSGSATGMIDREGCDLEGLAFSRLDVVCHACDGFSGQGLAPAIESDHLGGYSRLIPDDGWPECEHEEPKA